MMKTTPKFTFLLIICCLILSCNPNGQQFSNQLFKAELLSGRNITSKNISNSALLANIFAKGYKSPFGDIIGEKNFIPKIGSEQNNASEKLNYEETISSPETFAGEIHNYRKNSHFKQLKFDHYDRHLVSTEANDFSTDEFWATIAEID